MIEKMLFVKGISCLYVAILWAAHVMRPISKIHSNL